MAISDKLQSILDSKSAIKAAIEAKGVADVGDVLSAYAGKIASIQTGSSATGFTGHADVEGLKAIGWTDEDVEYYQKHGVNWNEEDDEYHKVPQDNIDLYGVLTIDNIQEYKDRIVYLPKIDTSGVTDMSSKFYYCKSMVAIPFIDTSSVKTMEKMFSNCNSIVYIPPIDTSNVTNMSEMFKYCYSITSIPIINTIKVTNMNGMFYYCYSLKSIAPIETVNVTDVGNMFNQCSSLMLIPIIDARNIKVISSFFGYCYSIQHIKMKGLKTPLDINRTSFLSKESILYIINNAAPTSPITITLSAYCYGKYNADPDVVAALDKQPNISLASA